MVVPPRCHRSLKIVDDKFTIRKILGRQIRGVPNHGAASARDAGDSRKPRPARPFNWPSWTWVKWKGTPNSGARHQSRPRHRRHPAFPSDSRGPRHEHRGNEGRRHRALYCQASQITRLLECLSLPCADQPPRAPAGSAPVSPVSRELALRILWWLKTTW